MIDEHLRAADDEDRLKVGEEFEEWLWIVFLTCSHARKQFARVKILLTNFGQNFDFLSLKAVESCVKYNFIL